MDWAKGGDCVVICNVYCSSGACSEPNVCVPVNISASEYEFTTSKADMDYYDENESAETSTTERETLSEQATESSAAEEGSVTERSGKPSPVPDVKIEVSTSGPATHYPIVDDQFWDEGSVENLEENQGATNWILWVSLSLFGLTICSIGFLVFVKVIKRKGSSDVIERVVTYSS